MDARSAQHAGQIDAVAPFWAAIGARNAASRRGWLKRLHRHASRADFHRVLAGRLPESWQAVLAELPAGAPGGLAACVRTALTRLSALAPKVVVLAPLDNANARAPWPGHASGLAASISGMALHGGIIPVGRFAAHDADQLVPALRLLARHRLRAVFLLAEPADPPCAAVIPGVAIHSPADTKAALQALEHAILYADGPSLIVLRESVS